jgi:hypothetical protein
MSVSEPGKIAALRPLIGKWATTIELLDKDGALTVHYATDTYRWALGKQFVFHDVAGTMAGLKLQTLEIIGPAKRGRYACRSYDNSGLSVDFIARLKGTKWSIRGKSMKFDGAFSHDGNVLAGMWKQKRRGKWYEWMTVTLEKHDGNKA